MRFRNETFNAQNTEISPSFLVWNFLEKHRFHRVSVKSLETAETVPFHKISTPGN